MPQYCGQNLAMHKGCGQLLTEENAYLNGSTRRGVLLKHICKSCSCALAKERHRLKRLYPRPPDGTPCACCSRADSKLFIDHDHITNQFRGYVCRRCNIALGYLGDNRQGVLNALEYITTPQQHVDHSSSEGEGGERGAGVPWPAGPVD